MSWKCWCGGDAVHRTTELGGPICLESHLHDPFSDGRPARIERLYIAGPMSGYPDANYPAFNEVQELLEAAGFKTVNPATIHLEKCHYVDLIREDLRQMLDCHGVATLDFWWESAGARNEVQVAGILKMPVRSYTDWLERAHQELNSTTPKEA